MDYRLDMLKSLANIKDSFKEMESVDRLNISRNIGYLLEYLLEELKSDNVELYKKAKELGL